MSDVRRVKIHTIYEIFNYLWSYTSYPIIIIALLCIIICAIVFYIVFNYYLNKKLDCIEEKINFINERREILIKHAICPTSEVPPRKKNVMQDMVSSEQQEANNLYVEECLFSNVPSNRENFDQDVCPSTSQTYAESIQMENQERLNCPQRNLKDEEQQISSVESSQSPEIQHRRRHVQGQQRRKSPIKLRTQISLVIEAEIHEALRDYATGSNSQVQNANEEPIEETSL